MLFLRDNFSSEDFFSNLLLYYSIYFWWDYKFVFFYDHIIFLPCFKPVVRFCWILFTSDKIYVSGIQPKLLVPLFCFISLKLIKGFSLVPCKRTERDHWEPVVEVISNWGFRRERWWKRWGTFFKMITISTLWV